MGHLGAIVIIVIVFAIVVFRSRTTHFECPNCGHSFKVSSLNYIFTLHAGLSRFATCPNCGKGALMTPVGDKN